MYLISWYRRGKAECLRVKSLKVALTVYDIIRNTWEEVEGVGFYESVDPDTLRPEKEEDPDCKYYHERSGGVCFAQKCAPACPFGGISRRCDTYAE